MNKEDQIKELTKNKYIFTETPSHGYLHVPKKHLDLLKIRKKISDSSIMRNKTSKEDVNVPLLNETFISLEEDVDAPLFIKVWEKFTGLKFDDYCVEEYSDILYEN